jgi:hypothetical protein
VFLKEEKKSDGRLEVHELNSICLYVLSLLAPFTGMNLDTRRVSSYTSSIAAMDGQVFIKFGTR